MRYLNIICFCLLSFQIIGQNLQPAFNQLLTPYIIDGNVDYESLAADPAPINKLRNELNLIDWQQLNGDAQKAFLINAYNIIVISEIVKNYPISSVQEINNFFNIKHFLGSETYSLDDIEKELLDTKADPRLHMALVCGAKSCPPLKTTSFTANNLDSELEMFSYQAVNSDRITRLDTSAKHASISTIFKWFSGDFGNINEWITKYSNVDVRNYTTSFQDYNWALNSARSNTFAASPTSNRNTDALRYYASNLYTKGQYEINIFNNYFTLEENGNKRDNFFTSLVRYTHGINKRVNFILEARLRSVTSGNSDLVSRFSALSLGNEGAVQENGETVSFSKIGVAAITPRIKYQPFRAQPNLTFQHGVSIPIPFDQSEGFFDWGSPSIYNDLFYDQDIGAKSSFFFQLGIYLENINGALWRNADGYYQFSTPLTFIYQYFASSKTTYYALINAAPQWGYSVSNGGQDTFVNPDSYNQFGLGYKYFLTRQWQIELLWTHFSISRPNAKSATYNLGIRYYGW